MEIHLSEAYGNLALVILILALSGAGYIGFLMGIGEKEKEDERNGIRG